MHFLIEVINSGFRGVISRRDAEEEADEELVLDDAEFVLFRNAVLEVLLRFGELVVDDSNVGLQKEHFGKSLAADLFR